MKRLYKYIITFIAIFTLFGINTQVQSAATLTAPQPSTVTVQPQTNCINPINVVNNPRAYLNKTITFDAEYISFSSLGLDYKPAFRDSSKYISVLIKRNDVSDHVIPLSEMKIFVSREIAEKNVDIEQGDTIRITGTVFSTALGDPWVDAKSFTIIKRINKSKNK